MDLAGTCPAHFWPEWLEEGNCAGDPWDPTDDAGWWTRHHLAAHIQPGDRFYVLARRRIRGYALVSRVETDGAWRIIYRHRPEAVTIPGEFTGFRGLVRPWWTRGDEIPFPDWKTA